MAKRKSIKDIPNCWDVMNCSQETCDVCPAWPDRGRECWKVTGTKCADGKLEKVSLTRKIMHCRNNCKYYKQFLKRVYP